MFTDPKALQIIKEEQAANNVFFTEMDKKIKTAKDNTIDEQIWTTPNQRRLIAAVPEMLAALEAAEQSMITFGMTFPAAWSKTDQKRLEQVRAAIEKAQG